MCYDVNYCESFFEDRSAEEMYLKIFKQRSINLNNNSKAMDF